MFESVSVWSGLEFGGMGEGVKGKGELEAEGGGKYTLMWSLMLRRGWHCAGSG